MTRERWQQIEALYQAVQERGVDVLADADPELRNEVEALLAQSSRSQILDRPAADLLDYFQEDSAPLLVAGTDVGPYQIEAPIGAGGMGEVWRARDTRLNRIVALKVSKAQFTERFEREARAVAALNHPNICTLHDVGPNYLVMEFVDGPTLAERIKRGALPVDEALNIAKQMADALEAAHEKGIVHRDLKPGNIKVKPGGTVKVLDFGLAKVSATSGAMTEHSPTITKNQTEAGVILGTAAYMSPEQARGDPVDKRADIYAFGAVLYEMVTGQRLHHGQTTTEVLASVLKEEPPWEQVPAQVQRLLRRCLEKDPHKRLRHIGDVMALVDEAPVSGLGSAVVSPRPFSPHRKWLWPVLAAGVILAAAAAAFWAPGRKPAGPSQVVRFEVRPDEKMTFFTGGAMAVSPDGRWMVFPAIGEDGLVRYWIRSLDGIEVRALPGTETWYNAGPAAWSFDSRSVLFTAGFGGKIDKVDIEGGLPQNIGDFPGPLNGAGWNSAGVIIAGSANPGYPILRANASGGQPTPITILASGDVGHVWPQFLPDGKHFLYERVSFDPGKTGVYVGSIDAQPNQQSTQRLLASDRQAYYAPAPVGKGYLIFLRQTTLMAQAFDPDNLKLSGEPVAIADGVDSFAAKNYGLFSVSNTGTLVYRGVSGPQVMLTWFTPQGNPDATIGGPGVYSNPAISPDGGRIAVTMGHPPKQDIWILDGARGTNTRFTFDGGSDTGVWSPDGKNIAFSSSRGGQTDLYVKPADSSGDERPLLKTGEQKYLETWTRDGRFLLFDSLPTGNLPDLWALPFSGDGKAVPLVKTQFLEGAVRVSPDGRWMSYLSNESGAYEIYVRPFTPQAPGTGAKWLVSKGAATLNPLWRPDGKVLFYLSSTFQVMAVDIETSKGFQAGVPRRMFAAPAQAADLGWDIAPDGKRFLFIASPSAGRTIPFTVVVNWQAGLK